MTQPFCFQCSETTFGPEVVRELDAIAEAAPPIGPEAREKLRALFASTRALRAPLPQDPQPKPCGH